MKKLMCILLIGALLLLSGCDRAGYEKTDATEKALATYLTAVENSVAQRQGKIVITIRCKDTVVNKSDTTERYEYTYTVKNEQDEHFDYRCYDDADKLIGHFKTEADGEVARVVDQLTGETSDQYTQYLMHTKNPISTLQLFRMDANFSLRHSTIAAVSMTEENGQQIISVSFHGNKLTGLAIKSENGLNRTVTSHERIYTLQDGLIRKIEIHDRENVHYNKETGTLDTDTIVEVNYQ